MKGTGYSSPDRHFLLPWLIGASIWGILSCILLAEYKRKGDLLYLKDIFFLLSLLWVQFGFAAIFNAVFSRRYGRLKGYIAVTILPPLLVYCLIVL